MVFPTLYQQFGSFPHNNKSKERHFCSGIGNNEIEKDGYIVWDCTTTNTETYIREYATCGMCTLYMNKHKTENTKQEHSHSCIAAATITPHTSHSSSALGFSLLVFTLHCKSSRMAIRTSMLAKLVFLFWCSWGFELRETLELPPLRGGKSWRAFFLPHT